MSRTCVLFTSPTCAPCRHVKPVIEDIIQDFEDISLNIVDITTNKTLSDASDVRYVPTMIAYYDNKEVCRNTGSDIMGYYRLLKTLRNYRG